ncbi:MAG: hypothetical protein KKA42_11330, partial [candidate division Zixibacteria bacterium]|nr:hypothetical protein [candidate division Zixibacteria bacterium]
MTCEVSLSDPVNAMTGNLFLESSDVFIQNDAGFPIDYRRCYNSYTTDEDLNQSKMWTHSYSDRLYETARWYAYDSPNSVDYVAGVTLVESNGRSTHFWGNGFGENLTFTSYGSDYDLAFNRTTDEYTVTTKDGTQLLFEYCDTLSYRLSEIEDRNGNKIDLEWSGGNLTKVSMSPSRFIDLVYTTVTGVDYDCLDMIKDSAGTILVDYHYVVGTGFLDTVTYADGSWEAYMPGTTTANLNRIVKAEDSDGATWHWQYEVDGRVEEACNSTAPGMVEHIQLIYFDSTEAIIDTFEVNPDSVFCDTTVVAFWRETTVKYNDDDNQVATYTSRRPIGSWRWNLETITDAECGGCGIAYNHDLSGQRTRVEYANGRVDSMIYDFRGNLETLILARGSSDEMTATFEYHPTYNLVAQVKTPSVANDTSFREIELVRDTCGNVTHRIARGWIDADSSYSDTTRYYYNSRGQVIKIDGPRTDVADTAGLRYDTVHADIHNVVYPTGDSVEFGTRGVGVGGVPYVLDPNSRQDEYTYDGRGRIDTVKQSVYSDKKTTNVDWTFKGAVKSLTTPSGSSYRYAYDDHNWLVGAINDVGDSIGFAYDAMSNMSAVRLLDDTVVLVEATYTYDWRSRLTEQDGYEFRYDAMGQLDTAIFAALDDTTFLSYDLFGRTEEIQEKRGDDAAAITQYGYDIHGNLDTIVDPDGNVYSFTYDDRGLLREETSSERGTITYDYDAAGNLIERTDANGVTVAYEYDELNRLTGIDYPDNNLDVTYQYDLANVPNAWGRLGRAITNSTTINYRYDSHGRLKTEYHTFGGRTYSTHYAYTPNDRIATLTSPAGVIYTYVRDTLDRVSQIAAEHGGGQVQSIVDEISYTPFGGVDSIVYNNDIVTRYSYDQKVRPRSILTSLADTGTSLDILRRSYEYDTLGNVESFCDSTNADTTTSYTYDRQNRLLSRQMGDPSNLDRRVLYTYYGNGNRKSRHEGLMGTPVTYNYTGNRLDSLTVFPDTTGVAFFTYDSSGNMVTAGANSYDYDQANRLVMEASGDSTYLGYNPRSQRQTVTASGETDQYIHTANGLLVSEYESQEWANDYVYLYGRPIAWLHAVTDTT